MSLGSINRLEILRDRAEMLARCRAFFAERGVLEVDTPILSRAGAIDLHIDLIKSICCKEEAYLHSSPEYGMKRLLAEGMGDIYQLSHVFRDHEWGCSHTSEFMMAEWYRIGISFQKMLEETIFFIRLFLEEIPEQYAFFTYKEAFLRFAGSYPNSPEERDSIYAFEVEPRFPTGMLTVVTDFPPEQAALAQIGENGLAERFEIYFQGKELSNGYHELTDPEEQLTRLVETNRERVKIGKNPITLDHDFIGALKKGLPDCCGVAVGFDRLMMLRHDLEEIRDASCFFI